MAPRLDGGNLNRRIEFVRLVDANTLHLVSLAIRRLWNAWKPYTHVVKPRVRKTGVR